MVTRNRLAIDNTKPRTPPPNHHKRLTVTSRRGPDLSDHIVVELAPLPSLDPPIRSDVGEVVAAVDVARVHENGVQNVTVRLVWVSLGLLLREMGGREGGKGRKKTRAAKAGLKTEGRQRVSCREDNEQIKITRRRKSLNKHEAKLPPPPPTHLTLPHHPPPPHTTTAMHEIKYISPIEYTPSLPPQPPLPFSHPPSPSRLPRSTPPRPPPPALTTTTIEALATAYPAAATTNHHYHHRRPSSSPPQDTGRCSFPSGRKSGR